jgi:mRNA-degrading endonuclease RelE of RelBE toxin-antitoxin system
MLFILIWTEEVQKDLSKLEKYVAKRIVEKVEWANEANMLFLEKIESSKDLRYRVGDYRVFLGKKPGNKLLAKGISHRKKAYKK